MNEDHLLKQLGNEQPVRLNRQQPFSGYRPAPPIPPPPPVTKAKSNRLESVGFYIFLVTLFLTPLAFLPTPYISSALLKTLIIIVGTLASAVCYGLVVLKEKSITLPHKPLFWTGLLLVVSLIVSSLLSNHISKALFGQGFEIATAGLLMAMFVAALVTHEIVRRDRSRVFSLFNVLGLVYVILVLIQVLRMIFGPAFLSLSVLTSTTSTLVGSWYDLGLLSLFVLVVSVSALMTLPLNGRSKTIYRVFAIVSLLAVFIVNQTIGLMAAVVVFAIMAIVMYRQKSHGRIPMLWLPFVLCLFAVLMIWQGTSIAGPIIKGTNTQYAELSLPWQITVDIANGTIKNYPWFGVGPNHFTEAYNVFKPLAINTSNAWSIEFSSGFGLIPTFVVTQGMVGAVLWILFLIFIGVVSTRLLKRLPDDPEMKFLALSSCAATILLFVNLLLYVPSHATVFITFTVLGVFAAVLSYAKVVTSLTVMPTSNLGRSVFLVSMIVAIVLAIVWGLVYVKKFAAFTAFASGVKTINTNQDFKVADQAFRKAISLDNSDVYWQAVAENDRLWANKIITSATSSSPELSKAVGDTISNGISAARQAVAYDPSNYYNYLSEARISDVAAGVKITNAYDNAVRAYTDAINLNPLNPSLYMSLAQSYAANSKFDEALRAIGAALQLKNNYLDAVYLLSQVQAAQGDLKNAIISTQVAIQMNPQNSLLFFQLGLLQYNDKNYASSTEAFAQAVKLTPNYANAQYFLGLSLVRLNRIADAVNIFTDLSKTNPDNKEIAFILNNLKAGKSPFADAKPPVTPNPEKRPVPPVKENK